jgi:hypothetical protein
MKETVLCRLSLLCNEGETQDDDVACEVASRHSAACH